MWIYTFDVNYFFSISRIFVPPPRLQEADTNSQILLSLFWSSSNKVGCRTQCGITKPNQNKIQRNRSRSKQEGGCSYPAYYLRVWNSPLKVLKECKDPAINVVDKSPKPVNNEFETPAVADSAMESSSQPSPVIAKSKRQSADQSVRYK